MKIRSSFVSNSSSSSFVVDIFEDEEDFEEVEDDFEFGVKELTNEDIENEYNEKVKTYLKNRCLKGKTNEDQDLLCK